MMETLASPSPFTLPPPPPPSSLPRSGRRFKSSAAAPRFTAPIPRQKVREANTNVFALALDTLASDGHVLTGDPVLCSGCSAALSQISKLTSVGDESTWTCEFCGQSQTVDLNEPEKPVEPTNDYLIEPAAVASSSDQLIVFVLDISGSMCVTTEVEGKIQLRGGTNLEEMRRQISASGDSGSQWLPGQNKDVTYISRLQGMQAAVTSQLHALKRDHPNNRVALITFASDVHIIGDGSDDPVTIAGDRLNDFDQLLSVGRGLAVNHPIAESAESLEPIVWELNEGGATALGPAAVVAVGLAGQGSASKIILCTDGLANVGVGSLDDNATPESMLASRQWYEKLGDIARSSGTTISVVSIAGSGCCMEFLGVLADATSGNVDIVDPLTITSNFASLLAAPTIATQVEATLLLHKALFIRSGASQTNRLVKLVGSVQAGSQVTFEFGVRHDFVAQVRSAKAAVASSTSVPSALPASESTSSSSSSASPSSVEATPSEVPFQVQVKFSRLDGSKWMRIVTELQPITTNRTEVEDDIDIDVVGRNALQQAAEAAHTGDYEKAKLHALSTRAFMKKNARSHTQRQKLHDIVSKQRTLEDAVDCEFSSASAVSEPFSSTNEDVLEARRQLRSNNDSSSHAIYQFKSAHQY